MRPARLLRALVASRRVQVPPVPLNGPVIVDRALEPMTDAGHRARAGGTQTEGG